MYFSPPADEVWGQGNVFTGVFDSVDRGVHGPGGCMVPGGAWSRGCMVPGVHGPGGAWSWGLVHGPGGLVETPPTATAAGGTHPTGMHSC